MTKFNIGTGDVLAAFAALCFIGGVRLLCRAALWLAHALGVM